MDTCPDSWKIVCMLDKCQAKRKGHHLKGTPPICPTGYKEEKGFNRKMTIRNGERDRETERNEEESGRLWKE